MGWQMFDADPWQSGRVARAHGAINLTLEARNTLEG